MEARFMGPTTQDYSFPSEEIVNEFRHGNLWEACCICCEKSYEWQAGLSEF
jgi:hypothetical protein